MGIEDAGDGSRNHKQCVDDERVSVDACAAVATGASRGIVRSVSGE